MNKNERLQSFFTNIQLSKIFLSRFRNTCQVECFTQMPVELNFKQRHFLVIFPYTTSTHRASYTKYEQWPVIRISEK